MFSLGAKQFRIIGDPGNRLPDNWSSAVQNIINVTSHKVGLEEM